MTSNLWVLPAELGEELMESEYAYEACQVASYLLWGMSGRKYSGVKTVTEHYEALTRDSFNRLDFAVPNQNYVDLVLSTREYVPQNKIRLRGQPVQKIISVSNANGDVYSEDEYFVTDRRFLNLRTPRDVDMVVTYTYGVRPPVAGWMAARRLAREFALLWSGSDECSLPSRVTTITRENVSYTMLDAQDFIQELRTGVYEVDLFIKTNNPAGAQRKSKVFSPDIRRASKVTNAATGWKLVSSEDIIP
jgi:hypothetical protein